MNRSMITAAVSMGQLQKKLDNIGNNLANVNTTGYKTRETQFSDLLVQQLNNQPVEREEMGRQTPNGIRQGVGARVVDTNLRLELGSVVTTDRELDLALTKENQFFQIQSVTQEGNVMTRYTRDGAFYFSPTENGELNLVTSAGDFVLGTDGRITFPEEPSEIKISNSGDIIATYPDNFSEPVGQISLVEITRPQLLKNDGGNLFSLPDLNALGIDQQNVLQLVNAGNGSIQQRALEQSNVDVSTEMTEMMVAQRSYQFNAKSISIADQMMGLVNGLR